jgi:hypothetical protein
MGRLLTTSDSSKDLSGPERLRPQDLVHRFASRQFIDKLVEVADFSHEWILDIFDTIATDNSFYEMNIWIHLRSFGKKCLKISHVIQLLLKAFFIIAREPIDYSINLIFGASLFLCLLDIEDVDTRK